MHGGAVWLVDRQRGGHHMACAARPGYPDERSLQEGADVVGPDALGKLAVVMAASTTGVLPQCDDGSLAADRAPHEGHRICLAEASNSDDERVLERRRVAD